MEQAKKVNDFISETATFISDLETARTQIKGCNREPLQILAEFNKICKDFNNYIKEIERVNAVNGSANIKTTRVERLIVALNSAKKIVNETYASLQHSSSSLAGTDQYCKTDYLEAEERLTSHLSTCLINIKELHQEILPILEFLRQLREFDRLKLEHHQQRIHELEQVKARQDAEIEDLRKLKALLQMKQMKQMKGDQ